MNRELMQVVEQTVRPILARHSDKMKMRLELYSLLEGRREEFIGRGTSEEHATQEAIRMFGEPNEIRAGLQATIPWNHRASKKLDRFLFPWNQKPTLRECLRAGMGMAIVYFLFLFVACAVAYLLTGRNAGLLIVPLLLSLCAAFGINTAVISWTAARTIRGLEKRDWPRAVALAALAAATFAASVAGVYLAADVGWFLTTGWPLVAVALFVSGTLYLGICYLIMLEVREAAEWEALELVAD